MTCGEDSYSNGNTVAIFPVCVNGWLYGGLDGDSEMSCPAVQCPSIISPSSPCIPTPQDTIEYLPPEEIDTNDKGEICKPPDKDTAIVPPNYGLDEGVPPFYLPVTPTRLKVSGSVIGAYGGQCKKVEGAVVTAWQIDATALTNYTAMSEYYAALIRGQRPDSPQASFSNLRSPFPAKQFNLSLSSQTLRDISCRGKRTTDASGVYNFTTSMPPPYGPPRHIVFSVTAPGYQPLITRMYFDRDWRLHQLTTFGGETQRRNVPNDVGALGADRGFVHDDDATTPHTFPGAIAKDPRVAQLKWVARQPLTYDIMGTETGYFDVHFDLILKPLRPSDEGNINPALPSLDLNGLWMDPETGGQVRVETNGNLFVATEYPHTREWGTVIGYLKGDVIRGVNFRRSFDSLGVGGDGGGGGGGGGQSKKMSEVEIDAAISNLKMYKSTTSDGVWSPSSSTGVVVLRETYEDGTDQIYQDMSISWSGGGGLGSSGEAASQWGSGFNTQWTKIINPKTQGYRYMKLVITRDTGNFRGGKMVINEIKFYDGILGQRELPSADRKMRSPRTPSPQMVTCSTFQDQDTHCWKAFDGDVSNRSAWMTQPVGNFQFNLTSPQWILFDLGPGRSIFPTALRIICGSGDLDHANNRGCPRTFSLLGSFDNIRYDVIMRADLFKNELVHEYSSVQGHLFTFFWESPLGKPNGHRCGSCDRAPEFSCRTTGLDHSCASTWCGVDGFCAPYPQCPPGSYMDNRIQACKLCAPGRYGNVPGLTTSACSGLCASGYYCGEGSSSATQFPCGSAAVFCPAGSGAPIRASAGRKTVGGGRPSPLGGVDEEKTRSYDAPCDVGHYCKNGVQIQCPVGRYGNTKGLQTDTCTAECIAGQYCPLGSINPTIVPRGYCSEDGKVRTPCPPGTFGATPGLRDRRCSGQCLPGYYCPQGSTSSKQIQCPAGRYGDERGLGDSSCSGPCNPGYYCPAGSTNSSAIACGLLVGGYVCKPTDKNDSVASPCDGSDPTRISQVIYSGDASVYCPTGSGLPLQVTQGYYTVGGLPQTRRAQLPCEMGFYCSKGVRLSCPAGTYGSELMLSDVNDTVPFNLTSFLNPKVNLNPTQRPTWKPTVVPTPNPTILGFPTTLSPTFESMSGSTSLCSGFCDPGYYCPKNSTSSTQFACPPGRYGAVYGLGDADCSGECPMGHYCPLATINPIPCRAGVYGNQTGLKSAACNADCWEGGCLDSLCQEGYYCPLGSISSRQNECGNASVFCPTGSPYPTKVSTGYYTVGPFPYEHKRRRVAQKICEVGYFCVGGLKQPCPPGTYGATPGLSTTACSGPCPAGYYCPIGTANATLYRCPAGTYGATTGLSTSACTGVCSPGYYCPEASTSPTQLECGTVSLSRVSDAVQGYISIQPYTAMTSMPPRNGYTDLVSLDEPNGVYCPQGSAMPLVATLGYYTIGSNKTTRSAQLPCNPGSYCLSGVIHDW